jgi:hypothetical protein
MDGDEQYEQYEALDHPIKTVCYIKPKGVSDLIELVPAREAGESKALVGELLSNTNQHYASQVRSGESTNLLFQSNLRVLLSDTGCPYQTRSAKNKRRGPTNLQSSHEAEEHSER